MAEPQLCLAAVSHLSTQVSQPPLSCMMTKVLEGLVVAIVGDEDVVLPIARVPAGTSIGLSFET